MRDRLFFHGSGAFSVPTPKSHKNRLVGVTSGSGVRSGATLHGANPHAQALIDAWHVRCSFSFDRPRLATECLPHEKTTQTDRYRNQEREGQGEPGALVAERPRLSCAGTDSEGGCMRLLPKVSAPQAMWSNKPRDRCRDSRPDRPYGERQCALGRLAYTDRSFDQRRAM